MFENLIEILKANPRKIVYTEGTDARILASAARLKKGGFLTPVLVGNVEAVKAAAEKGGFDIEGLEILDPATYIYVVLVVTSPSFLILLIWA